LLSRKLIVRGISAQSLVIQCLLDLCVNATSNDANKHNAVAIIGRL
jgi:hypothetical protein